jgi:hypothetical protein
MSEVKTHETNLALLTPGKKVSGEVFLVKKIEVGITKRNNKYYSAWLNNKHGTTEVKVWSPHEVLDTDDFVQMWMEVVDKGKWGAQWTISHYTKSAYEGDEFFGSQLGLDPLSEISPVIDYPFKDETLKSLVSCFRGQFLKNTIAEDSNFYNVPAYKDYYYGKSGLVQYLRTMFEICAGYSRANQELLTALILFHHLGSVTSFQKMKPTETYYLSNMKIESTRVLEELKNQCMRNGFSIDMYTFKELIHTCFNSELLTPEALIFRNARKTAIALYKLEKAKDENLMFTTTPHGVIFNRDHWRVSGQDTENTD